jgi:hypothetical protein
VNYQNHEGLPIYPAFLLAKLIGLGYVLPWWISILLGTLLLIGYIAEHLKVHGSLTKLFKDIVLLVALTGASIVGGLYYAFSPLFDFFFHTTGRYLLISSLVGGLSVVGVLLRLSKRWARLCCWELLIVTVTFPFVVTYQPALTKPSGYHMQWVTKPGRLDGTIREILRLREGDDCEYALLGWDSKNVLYYHSTCGTVKQFWQYDPEITKRPSPIAAIPHHLTQYHLSEEAKEQEESLHFTFEGCITDESITPNKKWTALVVTHGYGPDDIVILSKKL